MRGAGLRRLRLSVCCVCSAVVEACRLTLIQVSRQNISMALQMTHRARKARKGTTAARHPATMRRRGSRFCSLQPGHFLAHS